MIGRQLVEPPIRCQPIFGKAGMWIFGLSADNQATGLVDAEDDAEGGAEKIMKIFDRNGLNVRKVW